MNSLNPPKVAVFIDSLPMGGAEVVTLHLVRGFLDRGLHVDLILAARTGSLLPNVPSQARVISLAGPLTPSGPTFRDETIRMVSSTPALAGYLRREKPAVLIAAKSHSNVTAVLAARLAGYRNPVIITEHTNLTGELPSREAARRTVKNRILRRVYPLADRIVTVSNGAADDMSAVADIPRERIDVVYNPVIVPGFREKADAPLDHPWFQPGQPPVILGSGRFTTQKNFPALVRAFAKVRESTDARLVILGDGPEKPRVEALIRDLGLQGSVELPGFVSNPYPYLKRSGVFAYSSVWESFGLVLIEALALGTPVVSTACGAPQEILQGGRLGRLTPVGDDEALAEALQASLKEKAREVSPNDLQPFTLEQVVDDYLKLMGSGVKPFVSASSATTAGMVGM